MPRAKIGLFGGTFDPPHIGHLILASEAVGQLGLSRLLWMLAPDPPHKQEQPITPLTHRLEMLKRAIEDNEAFEISYLEIERPGPHYTIDTVRELLRLQPDSDLVLLLGGDSLRDLPSWREPAELAAKVFQIGVMRRPGDSFDLSALEAALPGLSAKVSFIEAPLQDLASREIRRRAASGGVWRYYVHPKVYEYIVENLLYRGE
jgi:nicotinate-nucleotide adenylyltransferase